MTLFTRRRFLSISAGCVALAGLPSQAAPTLYRWHGVALGAGAEIILAHPDAEAITESARIEIARLEAIFSLYQPDSALSRLNAMGQLDDPPFELLECLSLCASIHHATAGRFDPTVQPLWTLHADSYVAGAAPDAVQIDAALARTGWSRVQFDSTRIALAPGMALTLNGVAQGYIADRITALLGEAGLSNILVNTGEIRALGGRPGGGGWPVTIKDVGQRELSNRALATSAPLGMVFDKAGLAGHILDPRTGQPVRAIWHQISISDKSAALADALSTAACLMPDRSTIMDTLRRFPETRLEALI
ncbi:FAD:protein FMN transferase [Thioclava sp.]|uniref:FAD:protein FMN transferase n=1 Tax=Thioclava sp. TaxID=1933450 RepID=UPI003AA8923B